MNWVTYALLAALLWACCNVIDKIILSKYIKRPLTVIIIYGFFSLLALVVVSTAIGIQSFSAKDMGLAILAGMTITLMSICYSYAIRREEVSKLIPLFSLGPVFIAVFAAIMLDEVFAPYKYLAILLILVGAVTLSTKKLGKLRFNTAFWLMVVAAACVACTELLSKYLLRSHDFWSVFAYMRLGAVLAVIPIFLKEHDELFGLIHKRKLKLMSIISFSAILNILAILFVVIASSKGFVTFVNAITQVQPLFVLLLTILLGYTVPHMLKEEQSVKILVKKFGSISIVFAGSVLLII